MCFVETVYLVEAGRFLPQAYQRLAETVLRSDAGSYRVLPLTMNIVGSLRAVPRKSVPDLPDRIIAATALERGLPLITKDEALRQWDGITTLW